MLWNDKVNPFAKNDQHGNFPMIFSKLITYD